MCYNVAAQNVPKHLILSICECTWVGGWVGVKLYNWGEDGMYQYTVFCKALL